MRMAGSRSIRVRLLVWLSTLLMAVLVLASAVDYRQSLGLVWQAYDLSLSDAALGIVGFLIARAAAIELNLFGFIGGMLGN